MKLYELVEKYHTKNDVIIKRKKGILEFTITTGIFIKRDLTIYDDYEELRIGKTVIKMTDLRKMYFFYIRNPRTGYACSLEIVGKNMINSKSITITTLSEDDLDKIDELFNYFIFSNEDNYSRLSSNNYEFIIHSTPNIYKLNTYSKGQEKFDNIEIDNKKYYFFKILPKTYYKKYSKKKYLLFETKFENNNYMDVWIEEKSLLRKIKLKFALRNIYFYNNIYCHY